MSVFDDLPDLMDASNPLVYHGFPRTGNDYAYGAAYLRRNAILVPEAIRKRYPKSVRVRLGWDEHREHGHVGYIDKAAGDDRFIFFSLGWARFGPPSFAFRLRDLLRYDADAVGFRPHDLISCYRVASNVLATPGIQPWYNTRLPGVLRQVADGGTVFGPNVLALAEQHLVAIQRAEDRTSHVYPLFPHYGLESNAVNDALSRIHWSYPFEGHLAEDRPRRAVEIVFARPLPLRVAVYYANHDGVWQENPYRR